MGITNGINPVEIWLFKPKHLYSDRQRPRHSAEEFSLKEAKSQYFQDF